ncbi:hypothetical protein V8C42DRAFT_349782 [Trichoderma barbatum]
MALTSVLLWEPLSPTRKVNARGRPCRNSMAMVPLHATAVGNYGRAQLGYEDVGRETCKLGGGHCADRESSYTPCRPPFSVSDPWPRQLSTVLREDIDNRTSRLQSLKNEANGIVTPKKKNLLTTTRHDRGAARTGHPGSKGKGSPAAAGYAQAAAIYAGLIETEHSSLQSLRSEHNALATKLKEHAVEHNLFIFGSNTHTKCTCRASWSPSTGSTCCTMTSTMHELWQGEYSVRRSTLTFVDTMMNTSFSSSESVLVRPRTFAIRPRTAANDVGYERAP